MTTPEGQVRFQIKTPWAFFSRTTSLYKANVEVTMSNASAGLNTFAQIEWNAFIKNIIRFGGDEMPAKDFIVHSGIWQQ